MFSACPCENNGVCLGKDDDGDLQEDCDCSALFNFEGPTCGDATGSKLFWQLDGICEHHNNIVRRIFIITINQSILFSACPCANNGVCLGKDDDGDLQEDCDCSALFDFEGPTCGDATGRCFSGNDMVYMSTTIKCQYC